MIVPYYPLVYEEERRVLICIQCGGCISSGLVPITRHLSHHHGELGLPRRQEIAEQLKDVAVVQSNDPEGIARAKSLGFCKYLPVVTNGYRCRYNGCSKMSPSIDTILKHNRSIHKGSAPQYDINVSMQSLFRKVDYFGVDIPPDNTPGPASQEDTPDSQGGIGSRHARYVQQLRQRLLQVPDQLAPNELSLWDRKTGWPARFAGLPMVTIHASSAVHSASDPASWKLVPIAVSDVLQKCHLQGQLHSSHVLRLFRSVTDSLHPKPLRFIQQATLSSYITPWQRLMMYLVRNCTSPSEHRMVLSEQQTALLCELHGLLRSGDAVDEAALRQIILKISWSLIRQSITGDPFESPLIHWLGTEGFDTTHLAWRSASNHTPLLSKIVYCVRILGLADALPISADASSTASTAREYTRQYLHDGSDTMFTTLHSQRAYAKTVAADFYAHPSIIWSQDQKLLWHKGEELALSKLQAWVASLVSRARDILLAELIFRPEEHLTARSPVHFVENMVWATSGESFCNLNLSRVQPPCARLEEWATDHPVGSVLWSEVNSSSPASQRSARMRYVSCQEQFLELLFLLIHLTGGLPPRGTEVGTVKMVNTCNSMRNIYLYRDLAAIITHYNKSEAVSECPKVIARFLPIEVSQLLVAYLIDAVPFRSIIDSVTEDPTTTTSSPLLWHTDGLAWPTDQLSAILSKESEQHLGTRLTINQWRNIAIAIDKELIQPGAAVVRPLAINHTLQAGHTEAVEAHHYALEVNMLHGASHQTLSAFASVSRDWHAFWRFPSATKQKPAEASLRPPGTLAAVCKVLVSLHDRVCDLQESISGLVDTKDRVVAVREAKITLAPHGRSPLDKSTPGGCPVQTALKLLYGVDASFRSPQQEEAVRLVALTQTNVLVQLPTASGKSLAITIAAYAAQHQTTIVVVPYLALRANLIQHCNRIGLPAQAYDGSSCGQHPVVFVTPETTETDAFHSFLAVLLSEKRLRRVIFDECHVLPMDQKWRLAMLSTAKLFKSINVQKVWMSGTLPPHVALQLREMMDMELESIRHIKLPSNRPNICHQVVQCTQQDRLRYLQQLVADHELAGRTLIYVMSKKDGFELSRLLSVPFYNAEMSVTEQASLIASLVDGRTPVVIGTTAIGTGIDLPNISCAVHVGGSFGLVTYFQQACRAGRTSPSGLSISLVEDRELDRLGRATDPDKLALYQFLSASRCRRSILGTYLDGATAPLCGEGDLTCDNCGSSPPRWTRPVSLSWMFTNTIGPPGDLQPTLPAPTLSGTAHISNSANPTSSRITHVSDSVSNSPSSFGSSMSASSFGSEKSRTRKRLAEEELSPRKPKSGPAGFASASTMLASCHEVSGYTFGGECVGLSPSAVQNLKSRMERLAHAELLRSAVHLARAIAPGCVNCWLRGEAPRTVVHTWLDCPHLSGATPPVDEKAVRNFGQSIRAASLPPGYHFICLLPIDSMHTVPFNFAKPCQYAGLIRDILYLASSMPPYQEIFRCYMGPLTLGMPAFFTELVRHRGERFKSTFSLIFVAIVFSASLQQGSSSG